MADVKTTTAKDLKATATDPNGLKTAFDNRQAESQGNINKTYDTTLNQQNTSLQNAYNQNVLANQEARQNTTKAFDTGNADLQTQLNRNESLMNSFADARDINRQPGSQQALQLGMARSNSMSKMAQQRNLAMQENARQAELLYNNYQNQVRQAIAANDYKRAAALLDDYNNQNTWREEQAKVLASFGNFDAYGQMYGQDQAGAMRQMWIAQNPLVAYDTGAIDGKEYKRITGKNPPDYVASKTAGGQNMGQRWWYTPEATQVGATTWWNTHGPGASGDENVPHGQ